MSARNALGRNALGEYGERVAVKYLRSSGMQVLERRWRCRLGEIDIIARDGDCLVICEVKTRRSTAAGTPLDAVTSSKLARLYVLTDAWLLARGSQSPGPSQSPDPSCCRPFSLVRIDVLGVRLPRRGGPQISHLRGVQ
ncbi:MAG: putative endonuclease [Actinomycetota bacterium]|nr:putative endonuclease [Actinomycetota bacterium]